MAGQLTQTDRTTISRHAERGSYDREAAYAIIDEGMVAHVGFDTGQGVIVVPTGDRTREEQQRGAEQLPAHEEEMLVDLLDVVEVRDHDPPDLVPYAIERRAHRRLNR